MINVFSLIYVSIKSANHLMLVSLIHLDTLPTMKKTEALIQGIPWSSCDVTARTGWTPVQVGEEKKQGDSSNHAQG